MRRCVALTVIITFVTCSYTIRKYKDYEPFEYRETIHYDVGEEIDAIERKQYNLFWGIEDFEEAYFYPVIGGGYEVEIITKTCRMKAVNRDTNAIVILRDYISTYDTTFISRHDFETRWDIVDYDSMGFPITRQELASYSQKVGCGGPATAVLVGGGCLGAIYALIWSPGSWSFTSSGFGLKNSLLWITLGLGVIGIASVVMIVSQTKYTPMGITSSYDNLKHAREPKIVEYFE